MFMPAPLQGAPPRLFSALLGVNLWRAAAQDALAEIAKIDIATRHFPGDPTLEIRSMPA